MELVTLLSMLSAVSMLAQKITAAASTARKRKDKCRELAEHARSIAAIVRPLDAVVTAETTVVVRALRDGLQQALELVRSCHGNGFWLSGVWRLMMSGGGVDKFDDMEKKLDRRLQLLFLQLHVENAVKTRKILQHLCGKKNMERKMDHCLRLLLLQHQPLVKGTNKKDGNNGSKMERPKATSRHGFVENSGNMKLKKDDVHGHHGSKERYKSKVKTSIQNGNNPKDKVKYDNRNHNKTNKGSTRVKGGDQMHIHDSKVRRN